jgi:hypothetical protein
MIPYRDRRSTVTKVELHMYTFDTLKKRAGRSILELELAILAKAQEMRQSALHGETNDNSRILAIANYLEASVRDPDGKADLQA